MFKSFDKELIKKITIDLLIVFLFSIGSLIPMWGINRTYLTSWLESGVMNGVDIFSLLSGGSFKSMSFFALGIAPYISASIIVQLLTILIPRLDELRKQSQEKLEKVTYILATVFAIIQAGLTTYYFATTGLLADSHIGTAIIVGIELCLGTLLVIVLSKIVDKHGIGKGMSLILLTNIASQLPSSFQSLYWTFVPAKTTIGIWTAVVGISITILFMVVICLQNGEKRIPIQHAGQTRVAHKINYLPIKLNLSNVMPVIFTSSVFQVVVLISNFVENETFDYIAKFFNMGNWFDKQNPIFMLGIIPYFVFIIAFAYFYAEFSFDPEQIADNLKKQNIVIIGVRPGILTQEYLQRQVNSFIFLGATMLTLTILIPTAIIQYLGVSNFALMGTSVFILSSASIDLFKEIETEIITKKEVDFLDLRRLKK